MTTVPIFIFGTLLDKDVFAMVYGQAKDSLKSQPAVLPGFEPRYAKDDTFPVLVLAPNSKARGEVIFFEKRLVSTIIDHAQREFELCKVSVKLLDGNEFQCEYFSYVGYNEISDQLWDLSQWQVKHKSDLIKKLSARVH